MIVQVVGGVAIICARHKILQTQSMRIGHTLESAFHFLELELNVLAFICEIRETFVNFFCCLCKDWTGNCNDWEITRDVDVIRQTYI